MLEEAGRAPLPLLLPEVPVGRVLVLVLVGDPEPLLLGFAGLPVLAGGAE